MYIHTLLTDNIAKQIIYIKLSRISTIDIRKGDNFVYLLIPNKALPRETIAHLTLSR